MARAGRLKVYRTAIGFHDAYVAAPSQKAALEAWGSEKDLFARGVAEIVTDPDLTAEPLALPGKVVRRSRGNAAEQLAALPASGGGAGRKGRRDSGESGPAGQKDRAARRSPPPSRSGLEQAEAALAEILGREKASARDFDDRERKLARERKQATAAIEEERDRLVASRDEEAARYERAVRRWRD